jgi:hypothetical protein
MIPSVLIGIYFFLAFAFDKRIKPKNFILTALIKAILFSSFWTWFYTFWFIEGMPEENRKKGNKKK